jgi:uracil-DNA glycosylase
MKNVKLFFVTLAAISLLITSVEARYQYAHLHGQRGFPSAYDKGPAKDSRWLELFAAVPNYRGLQAEIYPAGALGGNERFRWKWGPIFYRGRLGENKVKVLIIGQEGAQDEHLASRAFTGGTGQRMQSFMDYIGINHDYLFLNTFIYCIHGQYKDEKINLASVKDPWLAQDMNSAIVQHRNKLLDYALEHNSESLRVVMAVGAAARESLVTWLVDHREGFCENPMSIETCDPSVLGENVRLLHVRHPGGLGKVRGGDKERAKAKELLRRDFEKKANYVAEWSLEDPNWLSADDGMNPGDVVEKIYQVEVGTEDENGLAMKDATTRVAASLSVVDGKIVRDWQEISVKAGEPVKTVQHHFYGFKPDFKYGYVGVPYYDYAFGQLWRLGKRGGTTSFRRHSGRAIEVWSDDGQYNDTTLHWGRTPSGAKFNVSGYDNLTGNVPYEPPKVNPDAYGQGPGDEWATLLQGEEEGLNWPNFRDLFGQAETWPEYEALRDSLKTLVVQQPEEEDEQFERRRQQDLLKYPISFGTGPIFRGRLDEATVLVVADQQSNDDLFTGRALSGDAGQKLQHLLSKMGITQSYAILRTLPVDTLPLEKYNREYRPQPTKVSRKDSEKVAHQKNDHWALIKNEVVGQQKAYNTRFTSELVPLVQRHPQVVALRKAFIERVLAKTKLNEVGEPERVTKVILTLGEYAREAVVQANTEGVKVVHLKTPSERGVADDWTKAVRKLKKSLQGHTDVKGDFGYEYNTDTYRDKRLQVNRLDLPIHTVSWMGTSGTLASRCISNPQHYKITMPQWAAKWSSPALTWEREGLMESPWVDGGSDDEEGEEEETEAEPETQSSEWE